MISQSQALLGFTFYWGSQTISMLTDKFITCQIEDNKYYWGKSSKAKGIWRTGLIQKEAAEGSWLCRTPAVGASPWKQLDSYSHIFQLPCTPMDFQLDVIKHHTAMQATSHASSVFFLTIYCQSRIKRRCQDSILGATEYFEFSAGNLEKPLMRID